MANTLSDWDLLTGGAKLVHFQKGEHIIKEGMEHLRIYQIALGEATITKKTVFPPPRTTFTMNSC